MILFTTGDILQLIDVPTSTFDLWCGQWADKDVVTPVAGGNGYGDHRMWSVMQAVGFVAADKYHKSEFSCSAHFIGQTVAAFGSMTEAWLLQQLKAGRRYYVRPHQSKPVLQADDGCGSFADLDAAYKRVQKYTSRKQSRRTRPANVKR